MTEAKSGDIVRIHYTGMLADGTKFDSSKEREPLQFEVGAGNVLPGLDKQVVGMSVGEVQTIKIPAEEAFGSTTRTRFRRSRAPTFPPIWM